MQGDVVIAITAEGFHESLESNGAAAFFVVIQTATYVITLEMYD